MDWRMGVALFSRIFGSTAGRVAALAITLCLLAVSTAYGLVKPGDVIDASSSTSTTQRDAAVPAGHPAPLEVADDLKSIGPTQEAEVVEGDENSAIEPVMRLVGEQETQAAPPTSAPPVTSAPATTSASAQEAVLGFRLIFAGRNASNTRNIGSRVTIDRRNQTEALSIEALATPGTESVTFYLDATILDTETIVPYDIRGRDSWMQVPGTYVLTANTYDLQTGSSGRAFTSTIRII